MSPMNDLKAAELLADNVDTDGAGRRTEKI